jgi:hypothetical protein
MNAQEKPFSMAYVLELTGKNATKAALKVVDFSIQKTIARLPEFENNPEKSTEVLKTLMALNGMKKSIEK